jgi:fluoride exporter
MPPSPQPSFLIASLLVAAGGALGSWLRFAVGRLLAQASGAFPWATLTVNVAGSLAMGLLVGWLARSTGSEATRLLIAVGLLGGFTTFSAFSLEVVTLVQRGQPALALTYLTASIAAGLAALWLGLLVMRATA